MKLADEQLRQAYAALSATEKRAVCDLLRFTPGQQRGRLSSSALRRVRAQLKRRARSEKPGRK